MICGFALSCAGVLSDSRMFAGGSGGLDGLNRCVIAGRLSPACGALCPPVSVADGGG